MADTIAGTSQDVLAVDLKTAARLLGLTEGAVRKQLAFGKREGVKNEKGLWEEVLVRQDEVVTPEPEAATPGAAEPAMLAFYKELLAEKDRRLGALDDEIQFLRQRVQNLEMLLGQSLQNQKALLPPEPAEPPAQKARRAWFAFGKRD